MMFMRKTGLAIAVAGAVSLGTSSVHAVEFNASTTMQNTLAVTVVTEFDIGTIFATETAQNYVAAAAEVDDPGTAEDETADATTGGVGVVTIDPDGTVTNLDTDGDPALTSLGAPTPAQGSVSMVSDFVIELPDTSAIDETHFAGNAGLATLAANANELIHESNNPAVPSLYMMHYRIEAVSGGSAAIPTGGDVDAGIYEVTPGFGENTFVFNIGATITTQPNDSGDAITYQEGLYSGTFEVTAAY